MTTKTTEDGHDVRIVVLGAAGVGKSALVMQHVNGLFVETYDPTLEDSFTKKVSIGTQQITVEILDTSGTDQFAAMRDMYIGSGDAFLLVYAVDSKASFNEASNLFERIRRLRPKKCPIMLVGNKADLSGKLRRVSYEQASFLAYQRRCAFIEASARKNEHVEEAFFGLLQLYMDQNRSIFPLMNQRKKGKLTAVPTGHSHAESTANGMGKRRKDCCIS